MDKPYFGKPLPKVKKKPFNKEEFERIAKLIDESKSFDKPKIEKMRNAQSVMEYVLLSPSKINELIDYVTELEDRVRVLESNNWRGHR